MRDAAASPSACPTCQPAGECNCPACQAAKKAADLKKAVASAYAPLFYNNNFAYINNAAYDNWYPGDHFKQMPIGDCWMVDMGGQYRARFQDEQNMHPPCSPSSDPMVSEGNRVCDPTNSAAR